MPLLVSGLLQHKLQIFIDVFQLFLLCKEQLDDCLFFHAGKFFFRISGCHGGPLPCLMVLLYQIFTVMASPVFQRFRYNTHIPGCITAKYKGAFFRIVLKPFIRAGRHTVMNTVCHRHPATIRHLPCALSQQVYKILCSAQNHPMYSGGFTVLTEFLGVVVSPSISQRNCCCVSSRTSSALRGHWNLLPASLLYSISQPSFSHTSPLMRSARLPQNRNRVSST